MPQAPKRDIGAGNATLSDPHRVPQRRPKLVKMCSERGLDIHSASKEDPRWLKWAPEETSGVDLGWFWLKPWSSEGASHQKRFCPKQRSLSWLLEFLKVHVFKISDVQFCAQESQNFWKCIVWDVRRSVQRTGVPKFLKVHFLGCLFGESVFASLLDSKMELKLMNFGSVWRARNVVNSM